MKNVFKQMLDWFVLLLTGKGDIANEAVDAGLIDNGGQGRDQYGK